MKDLTKSSGTGSMEAADSAVAETAVEEVVVVSEDDVAVTDGVAAADDGNAAITVDGADDSDQGDTRDEVEAEATQPTDRTTAEAELTDASADTDDSVAAAEQDPTDAKQAQDLAAAPRQQIDPRGPRFGAVITVVVLALALVTIPSILSVVLLVWQAIAFGAAALLGIQAQPYGILYRKVVAPKLGKPKELEDAAPPRFAQQVGLLFVLVALVGLAFGVPVVAYVATAFALAAAFLNAAFNFCLGCEIYLLIQRFRKA